MRVLTPLANESAQLSLSLLANPNTPPQQYRDALRLLGGTLGSSLADRIQTERPKQICVVCTVEDADSLATGIVDALYSAGLGDLIRLVCFWNSRLEIGGQSVAPILKEYREPCDVSASTLIVVKSIIATACVVRTNLSNLIADSDPKHIFIAAPVMLKDADQSLSREFPAEISKRFEYFTLAIDDEKRDGKLIVPGVGGDIYQRLGYGGFDKKNRHIPELVKSRRQRIRIPA